MKTHVIVTGAFGLIGSTFCTLLKQYPEIVVTKIKCDDIPKDTPLADMIIHGAGYGQPLKFAIDKIKTIEINTKTTIELFKYLKPHGKFLFISTSEVYSGADSPYSEEDIGTTTPQHPRACYIEGKRCGETICHAYRAQGFDVKIARLSLAYGPGTKRGDTRVLNQFIEQGFAGKIVLKDKGEAMRTYCFVDDAVDIMWSILLYGKEAVYNVGGFSTLTIADLAKEIGAIMNATVIIPDEDTGLLGAPQSVQVDMRKVFKEFGDRPFTSLNNGLKKTIAWQKKNFL